MSGPEINAFFRNATLKICSSLSVEEWLFESLIYIRRFVPAETVYLTRYYPEEGKQTGLARATVAGAETLDVTLPVPEQVRRHFSRKKGPDVFVAEKAKDLIPSRPWIEKGLLDANAAIMSLRLVVSGTIVGAVILTNRCPGSFDDEHAGLVAMLREPFAIALSNSIQYRELLQLKESISEDNRFLRAELGQASGVEIVGEDFGLRRVMELVNHVAPLTSPVLLLGETGTGKEVFATAIHNLSPRRHGPFTKVNCGAIPESLMDSELFGHEKGAFTGAMAQKKGRFERAHQGTLFLDEVGELKPDAQVRLLRVLQEKEIERVGGTVPIRIDTRIIAATHRDLESMVRNGAFREDLYFRLRVFPILIPPLRERKEDLSALAHYFTRKKAREMGLRRIPPIAADTLDALVEYDWPGNVRELENAIERALILNMGEPLRIENLRSSVGDRSCFSAGNASDDEIARGMTLDTVISDHIRKVLELTHGRVSGQGGAAEVLAINPSTLRKKMRKLRIPFGRNTRYVSGQRKRRR
ncbi:MAG: sigma 54-interacting transcriptional regulator [Deltaproteobacteria bacterium]|nr:sigma 54-interacting transcriptional regulator [Deltaproteobacteria bacterium]